MGYIIWKGVQSTTIKGLLVCQLPPITKPTMRVSETIIDGRDGSIIEELGYEPYDRTLSIALRGDFDIDEVMKYFTGEGEIVFSNEPDKVYRARIHAQIDYNRLLRFRQANILFRVQPYKYAYNEKSITLTTSNGTNVVNKGLETSKPKMTITGSGTIAISVNGVDVFEYTFPSGESQVVIDSEKEDAYLGNVLKNRNMNGEFPILQSGNNKIGWTGNVQKIVVDVRSRWL